MRCLPVYTMVQGRHQHRAAYISTESHYAQNFNHGGCSKTLVVGNENR